jgi:hypothetical protein
MRLELVISIAERKRAWSKMKQNDSALHEGIGTRQTHSWLFTPATKPERFAKAKELRN